jgi:hypothetical protein
MKVISLHDIFMENARELAKQYNFTYTEGIEFDDNDTYIIFGAHLQTHSYKLLLYHYKYNTKYIIINSEQPSSQFFKDKYYITILKKFLVLDYNNISNKFLKDSFGIDTHVCYFFDFPINSPNIKKEYDIVFIGTQNHKRLNIYNELKMRYSHKNILFDFDWNYKDITKLTNLLINTKIVLNIPYFSDGLLEIHRINKALSCGCIVVSEKGKDAELNTLYEDYIYFTENFINFDYDNLESKPEYYNLRQLLYKKYKLLDIVVQHNE